MSSFELTFTVDYFGDTLRPGLPRRHAPRRDKTRHKRKHVTDVPRAVVAALNGRRVHVAREQRLGGRRAFGTVRLVGEPG